MFRTLQADRDSYVTDKIVSGRRCVSANVGSAGSLDLFKLHGETFSGTVPNVEISRLLIHFDLTPLKSLFSSQRIDPGHSSFSCVLRLSDVYGGQPTPAMFDVDVFPLSASFTEGFGRDVVFYGDSDVCNFLTASHAHGPWREPGAGHGGFATDPVDYITSASFDGSIVRLGASQHFSDGIEDLSVDVTQIVSATLAGLLPDRGFRISYSSNVESDDRTYFVKRFAARTAFDPSKRPCIFVRYDGSMQDDSSSLVFDSPCDLFLRNRSRGRLTNILSASSPVTGTSCLRLRMETEVSGGWYGTTFDASQRSNGIYPIPGVYTSSVLLSSADAVYGQKLAASGAVVFRPIWESTDGSVAYFTGSNLTVRGPEVTELGPNPRELIITTSEIGAELRSDETAVVRIHIFDSEAVGSRPVKSPTIAPGITMRDVHAQVRDAVDGTIVMPFDTITNSSRTSSDLLGHFIELDAAALPPGRTYVIDVLLTHEGSHRIYRNISPEFRVSNAP
jgi:hypothetical protein